MNKRLGAFAVVALLAMEGFMLPLVTTNAASGDSVRMSVSTDKYTYPLAGTVTATISVTNLEPETLSGLTINTTVYDPANVEVLAFPLITGASIGALTTTSFNVSASFSLSDENYLIVSTADFNGTQAGLASVPFVVLSRRQSPAYVGDGVPYAPADLPQPPRTVRTALGPGSFRK